MSDLIELINESELAIKSQIDNIDNIIFYNSQKVLEALKVVGVSKVANAVAYIDGCGIETAIVKVRKIAQNNNVDVSKYQSQGCMITILIVNTIT